MIYVSGMSVYECFIYTYCTHNGCVWLWRRCECIRTDRTCELRRHLFNAICNPFSRTNVRIFYDDDYYSLKIYLYAAS